MVRMVDAEEVQRALERGSGVIVLDVLAEESYANRHLPGAHNTPFHSTAFDDRVTTLVPDRKTPIITYCASDDCSASTKAAERLEALGYEDVREFKAGLRGWASAGLPFEGTTLRMRADAAASETAA